MEDLAVPARWLAASIYLDLNEELTRVEDGIRVETPAAGQSDGRTRAERRRAEKLARRAARHNRAA